jgi:hypothetical protein
MDQKDFTFSDPEGKFSWINPMTRQREYIVPPPSHEEAIALFRDHPRFGELEEAYWEGTRQESAYGVGAGRDRIRSGLQRVEDTAESWWHTRRGAP